MGIVVGLSGMFIEGVTPVSFAGFPKIPLKIFNQKLKPPESGLGSVSIPASFDGLFKHAPFLQPNSQIISALLLPSPSGTQKCSSKVYSSMHASVSLATE